MDRRTSERKTEVDRAVGYREAGGAHRYSTVVLDLGVVFIVEVKGLIGPYKSPISSGNSLRFTESTGAKPCPTQ